MNRVFLGGHSSVDQMFSFEQSKQSNRSKLIDVNRKEPSGSNSVVVTVDWAARSRRLISFLRGHTIWPDRLTSRSDSVSGSSGLSCSSGIVPIRPSCSNMAACVSVPKYWP